ncbi:MAG TPA: SpoVG family protein [Methanofastidiosum sp.]|nr:SpoVG family protein [Methanofastidiosum sp.]
MKITSVEISLVSEKANSRLRGYAKVVFDDVFAVSNIRIIEGRGGLFVAMPSREKTRPCPSCNTTVAFRDAFCKKCGSSLTVVRSAAWYKDVAYPVTSTFAKQLSDRILMEYEKYLKSKS